MEGYGCFSYPDGRKFCGTWKYNQLNEGCDITISSGKLVNNTFQGTTEGSLNDRTLTMTTPGSIINDIYQGISVGVFVSRC